MSRVESLGFFAGCSLLLSPSPGRITDSLALWTGRWRSDSRGLHRHGSHRPVATTAATTGKRQQPEQTRNQ